MDYTPEQQAIKETVHEYAVEEVRPVAREADEKQEFPEDIWDGLAELDLTGLDIPEEYGGIDADPITSAIVNEEVAYGYLAVATALSVQHLVSACITNFGDEAHKERWLPGLASGELVGSFCLSEPHAGSNPAEMSTQARREGDEYVLDGEKQWITNGKRSDVLVVFAKTDREDPGTVTQFVVPKETDGVDVGEKEDKLGLRGSDTTPVTFNDARIPASNRLTEEGKGLSAALSTLVGGRVAIAAQAVGVAQAALDAAMEYAQEREQFDQPIGKFQSIRHKIADMETQVQAGRLLTHEAARERSQGESGAHAASLAKYFASEAAVDVTNEAIQIHGGYGYTTEGEVERFYRDAKVTTIYEGTSEIQKKIISRNLLGPE